MILSGRTVDASEAERMGLVSRVHPDGRAGRRIAGPRPSRSRATPPSGCAARRRSCGTTSTHKAWPAALAMENRNQELGVHEPEVLEYMHTYSERHRR